MSEKVRAIETLNLISQNVPTAGTVRVEKLSNLDYELFACSALLFVAGVVLIAKSRADIAERKISMRILLAIVMMILSFSLIPIFNYLFANNPNAPLFS